MCSVFRSRACAVVADIGAVVVGSRQKEDLDYKTVSGCSWHTVRTVVARRIAGVEERIVVVAGIAEEWWTGAEGLAGGFGCRDGRWGLDVVVE